MDYKQHKGILRGQIKNKVERRLYNKRIRMKANNDVEQIQIQFENMLANSKNNWWSHYKYPSIGCILSWLYVYGTFDIAENATVGNNTVQYHGEKIANYKMDDELQMPVFEFIDKYDWIQYKQDLFLKQIIK